jgi:hypothetical protein
MPSYLLEFRYTKYLDTNQLSKIISIMKSLKIKGYMTKEKIQKKKKDEKKMGDDTLKLTNDLI